MIDESTVPMFVSDEERLMLCSVMPWRVVRRSLVIEQKYNCMYYYRQARYLGLRKY